MSLEHVYKNMPASILLKILLSVESKQDEIVKKSALINRENTLLKEENEKLWKLVELDEKIKKRLRE